MNTAYFSAFAALAGSVIGGLTTFAAAWVTQRQQANVQWLLQEKTRRQELYQQFIEGVVSPNRRKFRQAISDNISGSNGIESTT